MDFEYLQENWREVLTLAVDHLQLSLTGLAIAIPIALLLSVIAVTFKPVAFPIVTSVGFLYTIPSLAMMAFLIPSQGLGTRPALILIVVYSQLFLVRNFIAGFRAVDPITLEAARGQGMTTLQVLRKVWLPLALPIMIAGVRTSLLVTIGIVALAAYINADGLGNLIFEGVARQYSSMILAGTIAITVLGIAIDLVLRLAERMTPVARAQRAGGRP